MDKIIRCIEIGTDQSDEKLNVYIGDIYQGAQGPQGPQGSISFTDLTPEEKEQLRGEQGPQGPIGATGPAGQTGPTGATGPQGPQGEKGAASIEIGRGLTYNPSHDDTIEAAISDGLQFNREGDIAVNIGDGLAFDENGAVIVSGGTGGGIEIVNELPASGTDGQTVLLNVVHPERNIAVRNNADSNIQTVSAIGVSQQTYLYKYRSNSVDSSVYVLEDNSVVVVDDYSGTTTTIPTGTTQTVHLPRPWTPKDVTFAVDANGFVATCNEPTEVREVIEDIVNQEYATQEFYTWSDTPVLDVDIYYSKSDSNPWFVKWVFDEMPTTTMTLAVNTYDGQNRYFHYVLENGKLVVYESTSPDTYSGNPRIIEKNTFDFNASPWDETKSYFSDNVVCLYNINSYRVRVMFKKDFYVTGWHKQIDHVLDNGVKYKNLMFYDSANNPICPQPLDEYSVKYFYINRDSRYGSGGNSFKLVSVGDPPQIFAPTTTGETGYVCVAGSGWSAPQWAAPETLTNGIKFWKGTQSQYDALQNYDTSTLYIIIP